MYYSRPFKQDQRGDYTPPPSYNDHRSQSNDWYPSAHQHGLASSRHPNSGGPQQQPQTQQQQQQDSVTGMLSNFSKALGKFFFSNSVTNFDQKNFSVIPTILFYANLTLLGYHYKGFLSTVGLKMHFSKHFISGVFKVCSTLKYATVS